MCYGNVRSSYGVRFEKMTKLQNKHIDMIFRSRNLDIYSSLFSVATPSGESTNTTKFGYCMKECARNIDERNLG